MLDNTRTQRQWVDPAVCDEARHKIEGGIRPLVAALLGVDGWDIVQAAEHAVTMSEAAIRLLKAAT